MARTCRKVLLEGGLCKDVKNMVGSVYIYYIYSAYYKDLDLKGHNVLPYTLMA